MIFRPTQIPSAAHDAAHGAAVSPLAARRSRSAQRGGGAAARQAPGLRAAAQQRHAVDLRRPGEPNIRRLKPTDGSGGWKPNELGKTTSRDSRDTGYGRIPPSDAP